MNHRRLDYRKAAAFIVLLLLIVLTTLSLLPLIETNLWWIRFLDFPRLQFALVMIGLLAFYFMLGEHSGRFGWVAIVGAVVAIGYHAYKLHPYPGIFIESRSDGVSSCF